jgi:light-regulated signal transduction histidine kinase (bacteriophytochrome)
MALRRSGLNAPEVRFGEADLTTCDREPIHIPGSIQPHGVLLVINRESRVVEQVAGDTLRLLGRSTYDILDQSTDALLDADARDFVRAQLIAPAAFVAPIVRLGVRIGDLTQQVDLTLHASGQTAMLEFEPSNRTITLAGDPIAQLKTLVSAIQRTTTLDECCTAAALTMRSATDFDRAMVYQFLPDDSGVVVAESAVAGLESFLGLHYPASDIPKQARELYRRNWLRGIPDIDYVPAPLCPATNPRTRQPIDMSHCGLRSVSPIHLEYLRNMGVCASLSASIIYQDKLWGMLVLHHYSPRHLSADIRVACETFAQILSLHVESRIAAQTTQLRANSQRILDTLVNNLKDATDIGGTLACDELLSYVGAHGAAVYFEGHVHPVGETPAVQDILAIVDWLNSVNRSQFNTHHLAQSYPAGARLAGNASGLLAVGLSRVPRDYVLWFRPEIGRTVRWAGEPAKATRLDEHGVRLTPRGSFAEWLEVTRRQSAPWTAVELEAAEALRVVFLETVLKGLDLARRERAFELARQSAQELEQRVQERTEQLRSLAAELEAAEDNERRQIARDLHDDLGQTLAAAQIRLAALCNDDSGTVRAKATEVGALIDRANSSVRSLAAQLAPAVLHELGLLAALEWLGEEIQRSFGLKVSVIDDGEVKPLSQEARSILYRAVRELLINVAKHAQTDSAVVECDTLEDRIVIRVSDSGVGYDPNIVARRSVRGLGLISVRERLSNIGGSTEVRSSPGEGTVVTLTAGLSGGGGT